MKKSVVVPLVMLASIATLTACTKPEMAPAPAPVTPVETVTPEAPVTEAPVPAVTTTKVVQYQSPAGLDDVEFTVTVENGIIIGASSRTLATNDGSKYNQDNFAQAVGAVVGKSVSGFDIDVLGGASLTTAAFENFVQSL